MGNIAFFTSLGGGRRTQVLFLDCVRNLNQTVPLNVTWEGTNLSGWAKPGEEIHWYGGYPTSANDTTTEPLWYGVALKKVSAATVLPKLPQHADLQSVTSAKYAQLNSPSDTTPPWSTSKLTTQSEGKIFIPLLFGQQPKDQIQLLQLVEQNPGLLTEFDMTFTSNIETDKDGNVIKIDYECSYRANIPPIPSVPFRLRATDNQLQNSIFHTPAFAVDYRNAVRPFTGSIEVHDKRPTEISFKSAAMTVLSPDGSIILGSIPIKYFSAN
jgi:hypothetical protein